MRSNKYLLFIFSFVQNIFLAQINLVPNPSFELYNSCPDGSLYPNEVLRAVPWYNPTGASPDYYNNCSPNGFGVPNNPFDYQFANTGNAYVGIYVYAGSSGFSGREYIQVKLTDSLLPNHTYEVVFFTSLALDNSCKLAISEIGALFSNDSITTTTFSYLNYIPQIKSVAGLFLSDTVNWMQISGSFIALGGEKYLTIGNFKDNTHTDTIDFGSTVSSRQAYYYIDDVSVIDLGPTGVKENKSTRVSLYPNPANTEFTLQLDKKLSGVNITLTDVLGNVVLKENRKDAAVVRLNTSQVPDGIYFVSGTSENGEQLLNSKIIIQH